MMLLAEATGEIWSAGALLESLTKMVGPIMKEMTNERMARASSAGGAPSEGGLCLKVSRTAGNSKLRSKTPDTVEKKVSRRPQQEEQRGRQDQKRRRRELRDDESRARNPK